MVAKSGGAGSIAGAMLAAMRRVLGLVGLALAVPWVACDDRTIPLTQDEETALSSTGGAGGGTGDTTSSSSLNSSSNTSTNTQTASGGSPNVGVTTFATHGGVGTTGPHPFGAGGDNDSGGNGASSRGDDSVGGGPPIGGITNGGNEGGQGPDCREPDCLICNYALRYCNAPTPDCSAPNDWLEVCHPCEPQCPAGFTCFEGLKCREACYEEGSCGLNQYCDPGAGACVSCYADEHCAPFGKVCLAGDCAECRTASDCSDPARPYCIAGVCRECLQASDCDGGFCNAINRCIDCFSDEHCSEPYPFCNASVCSECRYDADCGEGEECSFPSFTCSPRN